MNRRAFITAAAAVTTALAGCSGSDNEDNEEPQIPQPSDNPPEDGATVSLADDHDRTVIQPAPDWTNLDFSVEVVDPHADPESPPAVRITMTNTADEEQAWYTGHAEVFSPGRSEDQTLALSPSRDAENATDTGCWQMTELEMYPAMRKATSLNAGESASTNLYLWGAPTDDSTADCIPRGTYQFTQEYSRVDNDASFTWGFRLTVE